MILPCPACQARFMVPDERITPKGIKIRCPKCRFVFIMKAQKRSVSAPAASGAMAAVGAIGAPQLKQQKKKPARKRTPEAEAATLSSEELAAIEEEEILDMDELVQPTEQSGTAYNPNVKAEHFEPVAADGPSVMVDDSLLQAAAKHSATFVGTPIAAADLPRISPASAVSDTWIDLPDRKTPTMPPVAASGSMGTASGSMGAASGSMGAASGSMGTASGSMGAASGSMGAASGSMGAASGSMGTADHRAEASEEAAEGAGEPWPALEDLDVQIDEGFDEAPADAVPAEQPAPSVLGGVLGSVLPSVDSGAADAAAVSPVDSPSPGERFQMAYTLSAATSFTEDELAEFDEYEGLLVEERRALRKGHGATLILIVGLVLGAGVLGGLGYLGWQVFYPPKKQPPSWGHLQLSGHEHSLVRREGRPSLVKVTVSVKNASPKARFRNVHVQASLLSESREIKCQASAPCGPRFTQVELATLVADDYPQALRNKSKVTAYNVQLNPGQQETCQVLLFCGERFEESDSVRVAVDEEQSERVLD